MELNTTSYSVDEWAAARSAGWFRLFGWILGFRSLRSLHPRLYAVVRSADLSSPKSARLRSSWFPFKNTDHLWRQLFKRFGVALPNVLDEEMQLMLRCPGVRVVGWFPHSHRCLGQITQVPGVARKISADCCGNATATFFIAKDNNHLRSVINYLRTRNRDPPRAGAGQRER